jgi:anti-sigma regulatory factor (Ser/Thr protein kinase)
VSYEGAQILRLKLRCDPSAPSRAREALAELPAVRDCREEALLVVSELATNAVLHSGVADEGEFELLAEVIPDGIRIAVTDCRASGRPPERVPRGERSEAGGMGLWVVDALSRRWGTESSGVTRVWAELAV